MKQYTWNIDEIVRRDDAIYKICRAARQENVNKMLEGMQEYITATNETLARIMTESER
jgi:hypothetical protein